MPHALLLPSRPSSSSQHKSTPPDKPTPPNKSTPPNRLNLWDQIGDSLVSDGVVTPGQLEAMALPIYTPTPEEVLQV